jgi:hypothetical protein
MPAGAVREATMRSKWIGVFVFSAAALLGAPASAETVVFDFNSEAAAADFVFSYPPVFSRNVSGLLTPQSSSRGGSQRARFAGAAVVVGDEVYPGRGAPVRGFRPRLKVLRRPGPAHREHDHHATRLPPRGSST